MFQIDGAGIVNAKPVRTMLGVPGWYNQSPGSSPGTVVTGEWLNMIQGEMLSVLDAAGIVPDKTDDSQLLQALRKLIGGIVPVGARLGLTGRTAPAGWILGSGRAIGNAASGATERAHADTKALFFMYWSNYLDTELPIQTSAGASSVRGVGAQVDWDANKRMKVPDYNDRAGVGRGDMGARRSIGSRLQSRASIRRSAVRPAASRRGPFPFSGRTGPSGTGGLVPSTPAATPFTGDHDHPFAGSTDERSTMDPFIVETIIIKL